MKVLFVCTGNTCRSPMAEAFFNHAQKDGFTSNSAGIYASVNSFASKGSIEAMKEFGIDITSHRSKPITLEQLAESHLILTMEIHHKKLIKDTCPEFSEKVFTLMEYVCGKDDDISDPYGGDSETYLLCANEIKEAVEKLIQKVEDVNA